MFYRSTTWTLTIGIDRERVLHGRALGGRGRAGLGSSPRPQTPPACQAGASGDRTGGTGVRDRGDSRRGPWLERRERAGGAIRQRVEERRLRGDVRRCRRPLQTGDLPTAAGR